jgi:hypothetical protein
MPNNLTAAEPATYKNMRPHANVYSTPEQIAVGRLLNALDAIRKEAGDGTQVFHHGDTCDCLEWDDVPMTQYPYVGDLSKCDCRLGRIRSLCGGGE